jgi:uncharacterized protein
MSAALLSLVFLLIGLAVGYLAQRSRMCFVAGLRDWILVRDAELLTGLFSFLATVWVLSSVLGVLGLLHRGVPVYGGSEGVGPVPEATAAAATAARVSLPPSLGSFFWSSLGGGFLVGALSVVAGGCVLRQHVLCAQGDRNALFYLAGFYGAVPVYYALLSRLFGWVYG